MNMERFFKVVVLDLFMYMYIYSNVIVCYMYL